MLKGQDIVCFGPSDWWGMNPSCGTHIMRRLAKANRVLYVNPISSDLLGIRGRKGFWRRIVRKFKSQVKFARRVSGNLWILSPIFLPVQGNAVVDWINNALLKMQVGLFICLLKFRRPLVWVENVRVADIVPSFRWHLIIYHVSDRFEECPYTRNRDKLHERESVMTNNSDLIICVSKKLYESKKKVRSGVYYLPHGVDFELFRNAAENGESFEGLLNVPHPIAGYFGTLTVENDTEILKHCAAKLRHVSIVLAGQITGGDYGELTKMSNVILLGRVPYEEIPALCASFDVCLLTWKMSEWVTYCNPLKLFEYMASGKPIVSVPIDEVVEKYADIVSLAGSKEEYCDAIVWELNNDTAERQRRRIETAREHSWDNHIEQLSQIISDAIAAKKQQNELVLTVSIQKAVLNG